VYDRSRWAVQVYRAEWRMPCAVKKMKGRISKEQMTEFVREVLLHLLPFYLCRRCYLCHLWRRGRATPPSRLPHASLARAPGCKGLCGCALAMYYTAVAGMHTRRTAMGI
jgi:hypothetical protein